MFSQKVFSSKRFYFLGSEKYILFSLSYIFFIVGEFCLPGLFLKVLSAMHDLLF